MDTIGMRWYTLAEAAPILGVSVDTVRRRVKAGKIEGRQVHTQHGSTWEVSLGTVSTEQPLAAEGGAQSAQGAQGDAEGEIVAGLVQMVLLVDRLQQENRVLAGQVGFLTAQLAAAEDRLALAAPAERSIAPQPEPALALVPLESPVPLWRRLWPLALMAAGIIALVLLLVWPW